MEILGERPVAYNPALARLTDSTTAGILLSQLLYWNGKGINPEWFYKTIDEIETETALSRYEQDGAIKRLEDMNIIKVSLKGIPAKRHFQINADRLLSLLSSQTSLGKNHKLASGNSTNSVAEIPQTITENTQILQQREGKLPQENISIEENSSHTPDQLTYLINIPEKDLQLFANKFSFSKRAIAPQGEKAYNYLKANGITKQDYRAYFELWLGREITRGDVEKWLEDNPLVVDLPPEHYERLERLQFISQQREKREKEEWERLYGHLKNHASEPASGASPGE